MAEALNYTDEQINFVVSARLGGSTWQEVADLYAGKWKKSGPTAGSMQGVFRRHAADRLSLGDAAHPFANFTREAIGRKQGVNAKKKGVFVVTSASPVNYHSPLNDKFDAALGVRTNLNSKGFDAIQSYLRYRKAELVVLPLPSHLPALTKETTHYDPELYPFRNRFFSDFVFNENLRARELYLRPQQGEPLRGLRRLRGKPVVLSEELKTAASRLNSSLIVAHAKQDMECVATGNASMPRVLQATGCITNPEYLPNRVGAIAEEDHILGFLVVEVDGPFFSMRQIQVDPETGSFVDIIGDREMCVRFFPDRDPVGGERAVAMKVGDIHPGWHEQSAINANVAIAHVARPGVIFQEDWFDGASISHHLEGKPIAQGKLPQCFMSLESELAEAKRVLNDFWSRVKRIGTRMVLTASNHPDHILRYLDEGRYAGDRMNLKAAVRILHHHLETGEHPLRKELDPEGAFHWHQVNEDYLVEGVQMGVHGHLSQNGGRGSRAANETSYGDAMVAHSHTPSIRHRLFTVGHTSVQRHGYNDGPSTWLHCSGLVFRGGQKMLIVIVKGRWHA